MIPNFGSRDNVKALVISEKWIIDEDLTIPIDVHLDIQADGGFDIQSGKLLQIEGSISAPAQRIFFGEGRVLFHSLKEVSGTPPIEEHAAQLLYVLPQWFGAKGDYTGDPVTSTDNLAAFKRMIDSLSENRHIEKTSLNRSIGTHVVIPSGKYYFSDELRIYKSVRMSGVSGHLFASTRLVFANDKNGLVVEQPTDSHPDQQGTWSIIENLGLFTVASDASPSKEATKGIGNAIRLLAAARLLNLHIVGWGENGILGEGTKDLKSNANLCFFSNLKISGCGDNGIKMHGVDANAGVGIMIDVEDNLGLGILDSSLLGNTWISCHAQGNKQGAYKTDDAVNYALFVGCYAELDNESQFGGGTVVVGNNLPQLQTGAAEVIGYGRSKLRFSDIDKNQHRIALNIPFTAKAAALTHSHSRERATYTIATLEFTPSSPGGATIPKGTIVSTSDGIGYRTDADLVISTGQPRTVSATSVRPGTQAHVDLDTLTIMPLPLANVASVRNTSGVVKKRGKVRLLFRGNIGAFVPAGTLVRKPGTNITYETMLPLRLLNFPANDVAAQCVDDGQFNFIIGELTEFVGPQPSGIDSVTNISEVKVGAEGTEAWNWGYGDPDVPENWWSAGRWWWSLDNQPPAPFGFTGFDDPFYKEGQFFLGNSMASSKYAATETITQRVPGNGGSSVYAFRCRYRQDPNSGFFEDGAQAGELTPAQYVTSIEVVAPINNDADNAIADNIVRGAGYQVANEYHVKITNNNPQSLDITVQMIAFRTHQRRYAYP